MNVTRINSRTIDTSRVNWAIITVVTIEDSKYPWISIDGVFHSKRDADDALSAVASSKYALAEYMRVVQIGVTESTHHRSAEYVRDCIRRVVENKPFALSGDHGDVPPAKLMTRQSVVDERPMQRILSEFGAEPFKHVALIHIYSHTPSGQPVCLPSLSLTEPFDAILEPEIPDPVFVICGVFRDVVEARGYCKDYYGVGQTSRPDGLFVETKTFFNVQYLRSSESDACDIRVGGTDLGLMEYIGQHIEK